MELLTIDNINEINYYANLILKQKLSVRELRKRIKNKEYENLNDVTKQKLINDEDLSLVEKVPNPIFIMKYCSDDRVIFREYVIS